MSFVLTQGDEELFEKKLSKEEKKALAKAKREAKKKAKKGETPVEEEQKDAKQAAKEVVAAAKDVLTGETNTAGDVDDGIDHEAADALAAAGTICTFSASRKGVDARSRDVNVTNFTLQHMGGTC